MRRYSGPPPCKGSAEPLSDGSMPAPVPLRSDSATPVIDRIVTIIGGLGITPQERSVWNREIGRIVNMARGGKADQVRTMLADIGIRLNNCLLTTLQTDLDAPADTVVEAIAHGYTVGELYEVHDASGRPLQARAEGIAELQDIVRQLHGQVLPVINRAATQASAALNSEKLKQSQKGRAARECEQLLMHHAGDMKQFLQRLDTPVMQEQAAQSPTVLALAMRRFGALSVHFLGYDQARLQNRDRLTALLTAGCKEAAIEQMTMRDVSWVIESLRQLTDEASHATPELTQFFTRVIDRCLALADENDDTESAVKILHAISRLHLAHPRIGDLRSRLVRSLADSASGLSAREVAGTIESWRRSAQTPTAEDDQAVAKLMERGTHMVDTYDQRTLVGSMHDVAELTTVRRLPAARTYVQSLTVHGTPLAGTFDPQDVARSLRFMGLTAGDDIDERPFTEAAARRGAQLLADPSKRRGFGHRDVGMSLLALADLERMRAQRFGTLGTAPAQVQFIDGLAARSAELADRHDAVSGASCFSAFAHIEHRSPPVVHMLRKLAQTGPQWSTSGSYADCEKRQGESLWSIARMGLDDEHAVEFARFLASQLTQRLPYMNLPVLARNLWSCMVIQQVNPGALPNESLKPLMHRVDQLVPKQAKGLQFMDAIQLYQGLAGLRGSVGPELSAICAGDADEWTATGVLPQTFRRHSEARSINRSISDAERDVRDHLQERFGSDAQPDVLHHGYGLDIALRISRPGQPPFLVDVEVDGLTHQSSRYRHTDVIRDRMLEAHFNTVVIRLPYCNNREDLLQAADTAIDHL